MTQFMPYPTTDDEEPDHESAAEEMGFADANRRDPVFISDGTEIDAVVDVDTETGDVTLMEPHILGVTESRTVPLGDLWSEWRDDELLHRKRRFLYVEEDTYDTEREVAVERTLISDALEVAHSELQDMMNADSDGPWTEKVNRVVERFGEVLDG